MAEMTLADLSDLACRLAPNDGMHASLGSPVRINRRSMRTAPRPLAFGTSFGIVVAGEKRFEFGGAVVDCQPGTCILAARRTPTICGVSRVPYLAVMVALDPRRVAEVLAETSRRPSRKDIAFGTVIADDVVLSSVASFVDRPGPEAEQALITALAATEVGDAILGAIAAEAIGDPLVKRAAAWIDENLATPLSIAALSRRVGASVSTLHHRFKVATGTSPLQYQKRRRLAWARDLMVVERLGPGVAARAVGYASASQFSRDYRRAFAVPPARDLKMRAST
jgi:AraC-like DNA-binding protein